MNFNITNLSDPKSGTQSIYLSPLGCDENAGTCEAPLKTPYKAIELAQKHKGQTTIWFAAGVYRLDKTLKISALNSNLSLKAQEPEKVIFSGAFILEGLKFTPYRDNIMQAKYESQVALDQLFINGKRANMARFPNTVEDKNIYGTWNLEDSRDVVQSENPLSLERIARWENPQGGYIHAMHEGLWGDMKYLIQGKNSDGTLIFEGGWQNNRDSEMHPKYRIVENIFEELDAPNEWFYDQQKQILYIYPEAGVDLNSATIESVSLKHLIEVVGTKDEPVKNVTFSGINFKNSARTFMETKEPLLRSDWTIYRGGAVVFENSESCVIKNCSFNDLGSNGIFVSNYNYDIKIIGCHIYNIGASGIVFAGNPESVRSPFFKYGNPFEYAKIDRAPGAKSKDYPHESLVEDCLIHLIGRDEKQTAGVQVSMSQEITIRHCSIYDVPRAGINFNEGTWGGHLIEYCDVFNTVLETSDHGSFNSWGRDRFWSSDRGQLSIEVDQEPTFPLADITKTNIIRRNRWRCDHGWDIDLDDGSSNFEIYENLLLHNGLKLREGYHRVVRNNIMVNNGLHAHCWLKDSGDIVTNNVVQKAHFPLIMSNFGLQVDYNYFVSNQDDMEAYYDNNWDLHSQLLDAEFKAPQTGDYTITNLPKESFFHNFKMDYFGVSSSHLKSIAKKPQFPMPKKMTELDKNHDNKGLQQVHWHGFNLCEISIEEFSAYGIPQGERGLVVLNENDKLQKGDLIIEINQQKTSDVNDLKTVTILQAIAFKVIIIRNQQKMEIDICLIP